MRSILLAAMAVCTLLLSPAWAEQKASLRLNWLIYGFHTPFYLGVEKGFYRQNGIDLTIGEGQGSGRAVQTVATGSDTFGLADGASIMAVAVKGAPVQAVMGVMNQSPYAIIVRKDSGITTLQGLAGKTLAGTAGEAGLAIFPAILKRNEMDADAIRFLHVDGAAKLVAILQNRTVGMLGGLENQTLILEARGLPVVSLPYADLGVNTVGLSIVVSRETETNNPALVRGFIKATQEAYETAERDPEAAVQAGMRAKPTMEHDLALAQLKAGLALLKSPHGKDKPIGWMSAEDWSDTLALAKQYQGLQTDAPATAFYTVEFLPH